jgi:8-oxo-dGTP pyrophosphatase MutT (NUDIX family)
MLIEQFRAGSPARSREPWMLELVAGIVEAGESDEDVVRREADGEAGCTLAHWCPSPATTPAPAPARARAPVLRPGAERRRRRGARAGREGEDILVHRLPAPRGPSNCWPRGVSTTATRWSPCSGLPCTASELRERWLAAPETMTRGHEQSPKPAPRPAALQRRGRRHDHAVAGAGPGARRHPGRGARRQRQRRRLLHRLQDSQFSAPPVRRGRLFPGLRAGARGAAGAGGRRPCATLSTAWPGSSAACCCSPP